MRDRRFGGMKTMACVLCGLILSLHLSHQSVKRTIAKFRAMLICWMVLAWARKAVSSAYWKSLTFAGKVGISATNSKHRRGDSAEP